MRSKSRVVSIDVLRGFALLGIVGANIVLYDIDQLEQAEAAFTDLPVGPLGAPFMVFSLVLVVNKMMAVFSMLFGASLVLSTESGVAGRPFNRFLRRNLLLVAIGLLHTWFWVGDILTLYGLCALPLYFCRKLTVGALMGLALVLWFWAPVGWLWLGIGPNGDEFFSRALSMMLFGMSLYRLGVITGEKSREWYRRYFIVFFLIGLPPVLFGWLDESIASSVNNLGVPPMAFSYICLVMWWCKTGLSSALRTRLAAAGQMALTNYLAQTVLGVSFYRMLEIAGHEPTAALLGIGMLLIWSAILWWSPWWLTHFRFGPLEWLWRMGTFGHRFPLRRDNSSAV